VQGAEIKLKKGVKGVNFGVFRKGVQYLGWGGGGGGTVSRPYIEAHAKERRKWCAYKNNFCFFVCTIENGEKINYTLICPCPKNRWFTKSRYLTQKWYRSCLPG
jgi:hypothetical protein